MAAAGTEDGRNRNAVEMGFIGKEFYESGIFSGTGKRGIKEKMVPAGGIAVRQKNK